MARRSVSFFRTKNVFYFLVIGLIKEQRKKKKAWGFQCLDGPKIGEIKLLKFSRNQLVIGWGLP